MSIVAEPAACPVTAWQTEAMLVGKEGQAIVRGTYDGYGRIGEAEIEGICGDYDRVWLYHAACYDSARRAGIVDPSPSENARDQGYFFEPGGEHDAPPPSVDADWLQRQAKLRRDSKPRDTQSPLGSKPWLAAAGAPRRRRAAIERHKRLAAKWRAKVAYYRRQGHYDGAEVENVAKAAKRGSKA